MRRTYLVPILLLFTLPLFWFAIAFGLSVQAGAFLLTISWTLILLPLQERLVRTWKAAVPQAFLAVALVVIGVFLSNSMYNIALVRALVLKEFTGLGFFLVVLGYALLVLCFLVPVYRRISRPPEAQESDQTLVDDLNAATDKIWKTGLIWGIPAAALVFLVLWLYTVIAINS